MSVTDKIYQIIEEKHFKQSAIAQSAGYTIRQFNDMLRGRKRITATDVIPICRVLAISPNELFGFEDNSKAS